MEKVKLVMGNKRNWYKRKEYTGSSSDDLDTGINLKRGPSGSQSGRWSNVRDLFELLSQKNSVFYGVEEESEHNATESVFNVRGVNNAKITNMSSGGDS